MTSETTVIIQWIVVMQGVHSLIPRLCSLQQYYRPLLLRKPFPSSE